jgi:hypothetical protein
MSWHPYRVPSLIGSIPVVYANAPTTGYFLAAFQAA